MMSKIGPIVAFIVALLIFFIYVNPTYTGSIATEQSTITNDNQALAAAAQYSQKQNELISAEKNITANSPDALTRLDKLLPDSVNNVGLILDLDALAAKEGLTLTSINVAAGQLASDTGGATNATAGDSASYGSVNLTLTASGSYAAFRNFLSSLEHSARLLDVTNLGVAGSDTGVYTYNMTVRLYWLK
jgi:Tfp pilus assembly protein PilO